MNLDKIFIIISFIIGILSFSIVHKKISKVKIIDFRFTLLCLCLFLFSSFINSINSLLAYLCLLLEPIIIYFYFYRFKKYEKCISVFATFLIYSSVTTSETFFSVIISSVTGDKFVDRYWGLFYIFINIISLIFILKAIDYFKFNFKYFKKADFKENILQLNFYLLFIHFVLNLSHWLSNMKNLNSFSSMIATICFLMFMSTLFYLQSIREKYEKEEQIKQKEREQLQLQKYTDEIVSLYNEIRGFRHDYGGMLASFQSAIHTADIKEVERIYQEVLVNANLQLRSDKYTYFDLNNVGDSALRSVMTQTLFKTRDYNIELTFEVKDFVKPLPIKLLDLVRMTSVLLNNAIEGAAESYQKTMNVSLVDLDTETILVIQNSRKKRPLDLEEIYQTDFSTKGEGRGLGLSNIKEIINNYEGIILDTKIEDEYFTQVIRVRKEGL
ncbi:GHKL domain-containing protein [Streptococcus anginosus]|uniref:GHKL domain protein n=1 Tax=Streptococcus anginosus subsp. whileyi CCUG 39159 TaxID=1095729 RepID=I0S833_STRAP|nr:GHKL domain-containing protein [Streptococcus anginosus]AGU84504.1 histidine kinase [Streptococcus anginosus C238]EID19536.1 GHKL domain protein [Streptococcus anginosus subsp. whileyi CCUG 39159]MDB8661819.1 GHKL domain-containing protein [Streptococcus anginosus]MDP1385694.1 GHKL domain-containing protein [Streptococcus anginosus]QQT08789.1 GHKL domain-containing protein [Streptococcus anginosus]